MEPDKVEYREDAYHKDMRERVEKLEKTVYSKPEEDELPKRKPGRPPKVKEQE